MIDDRRRAPPTAAELMTDGPVRDLWGRAAVRERFQSGDLLGGWLGARGSSSSAQLELAQRTALDLQLLATPAEAADGSPAVRLRQRDRVRVLNAIGAADAKRFLDEIAPDDKTQGEALLSTILNGDAVAVDAANRLGLATWAQVAPLAEAVGASIATDLATVRRRMDELDFLNLVGGADLPRFIGRTRELAKLHRAWARGVPVVEIEAPGGMGKSMLIARFVSELLENPEERPTAIFHVDFDRRDLQRARPVTILAECLRQVDRWIDEPRARRIAANAVASATWVDDEDDYGHSRASESFSMHQDRFAADLGFLLRESSRHKRPRVVIIADSAEQVFDFNDLAAESPLIAADMLRREAGCQVMVIYGSRHFPPFWRSGERRIILGVLSPDQAKAYLTTEAARFGVTIAKAHLTRVIGAVGRSPLALRFAARLLASDEVDDAEAWLDAVESDPERIQATLYDRVLRRIRDPALRRLARPGLLVRRLTTEVISQVLAGPCDLDFREASPDGLLAAAEMEGQLFRRDPADPGAVWHRSDVRALMLRDLDATIPSSVARAINLAAIEFYACFDDPISRGEELYHRLRLGQSGHLIAERWIPEAGDRLKLAAEEFGPGARSTLRSLLGTASLRYREGVKGLREAEEALTDFPDGYAELRRVIRRDIQQGLAPLPTLARYGLDRLDGPLGDVYAEALVVAGCWHDLLIQANRLRSNWRHVPPSSAASIYATTAGVLEGLGRLSEAFTYWDIAGSIVLGPSTDQDGERLALGVSVGQARIRRKTMPLGVSRRNAELDRLFREARGSEQALHGGAVLLRELVAELIEILGDGYHEGFRQVFDWLQVLLERNEAFPSALDNPARAKEIARVLGAPDWPMNELMSLLRKQLYEARHDERQMAAWARLLREEVDWTLAKAVSRRSSN
ncbi:AAA family ATPase [Caulobacter rhizosphaerae]|uniref:AAA family ATPase n=1 Tax=Caulobacter rhizosphaerae TaxID=2010972 RepID=UPI0013D2749E|nr:AAA family ATPase [Caulobacter rhizosphaerae]GGL35552.1 hypothetical protein GCM10010983_35670 [Caulobacter rhizosphaerae]